MWISSKFWKKSAYKVCLQRNQIEVGKLCCKHVQHMNILSWTVHIMCWIRPQASSLLHLCTSVYNVHYTCTLSQQTSSSWISLTNNTQTLSKENNWNISLFLCIKGCAQPTHLTCTVYSQPAWCVNNQPSKRLDLTNDHPWDDWGTALTRKPTH